jgi:hypothetical protein
VNKKRAAVSLLLTAAAISGGSGYMLSAEKTSEDCKVRPRLWCKHCTRKKVQLRFKNDMVAYCPGCGRIYRRILEEWIG